MPKVRVTYRDGRPTLYVFSVRATGAMGLSDVTLARKFSRRQAVSIVMQQNIVSILRRRQEFWDVVD